MTLYLKYVGMFSFLLSAVLTVVCSTIQAFSDNVAHVTWLPLVGGQKKRGVREDFSAPRLRAVTQAVGRCNVFDGVCACVFK